MYRKKRHFGISNLHVTKKAESDCRRVPSPVNTTLSESESGCDVEITWDDVGSIKHRRMAAFASKMTLVLEVSSTVFN
jgi:hypothetical protein